VQLQALVSLWLLSPIATPHFTFGWTNGEAGFTRGSAFMAIGDSSTAPTLNTATGRKMDIQVNGPVASVTNNAAERVIALLSAYLFGKEGRAEVRIKIEVKTE
jgi:hypothetical protein